MSNTYSSTLKTDFLAEVAITPLQNRWGNLKAFAHDFGTDLFKPRAKCQAKFVTAGGTSQKNATDFEAAGNSTITNKEVVVDQYTTAYQVSNDDLNSGLRMADLLKINLAAFFDSLMDVALTPVTETNFKNYNGGSYLSSPAAFGWGDMSQLWGALKKADRKFALLDGEYMAGLLNTPTFFQAGAAGGEGDGEKFGWAGLFTNTRWNGAGAGVRGFIAAPQAVGVCSGLPLLPNQARNVMDSVEFTIPAIGLTCQWNQWFSLSSRTLWQSFDVMFGSTPLDTTAGIIVKAS